MEVQKNDGVGPNSVMPGAVWLKRNNERIGYVNVVTLCTVLALPS